MTSHNSTNVAVRMHAVECLVAPLVVGLICGGCRRVVRNDDQAKPRYVVTASPIDVRVGSGLCVAVDPSEAKGVWWWQPGKDCSSRSTSMVFDAEEAAVVPSESRETVAIRFRVPVKRRPDSSEPPFIDVSLRLEGGQLRAEATGSQVAAVTRADLEIPAAW
jgi:hypothetical protein